MATAEIIPNVPAVYGSIAAILASLGVKKSGHLPSNMGGKPYITAVDVAQEVKTLLVANDLIALPEERVTKHEYIVFKERLNVLIGVEAKYTFVSTLDGSKATVTGVGDGLAAGTAVASNIASTNALKNAMLRTFMITEQSVEDAAKNGVSDEAATQPKAIAAAQRGSTQAPAAPASNEQVANLREEIKQAASEGQNFTAIGARLYPGDAQWANKVNPLKAVLKALQNGEVE